MLLPKAFLTTVLQDYGRSQGLSIDALTFTHDVLSDPADTKEKELSLIIQKKLNIVRRAFKVLARGRAQTERPRPRLLSPSFPQRALIRPLVPHTRGRRRAGHWMGGLAEAQPPSVQQTASLPLIPDSSQRPSRTPTGLQGSSVALSKRSLHDRRRQPVPEAVAPSDFKGHHGHLLNSNLFWESISLLQDPRHTGLEVLRLYLDAG